MPCVRLQDCRLEPPRGKYGTLSHRWSNSNPLKLLQGNVEQLKAGIPFTSLSVTFQNAAQVAMKLDCRYIWIDSLCIIQDSQEDWAREANLMREVYRNGYINISATNRQSLEEGLFVDRLPHSALPIRVELPIDPRSTALQKYEVRYKRYWEHAVADAPINRRAWVTQERLLSPRVLHFASNEIAWECCEREASEVYPTSIPSTLWSTAFKRLPQPTEAGLDSSQHSRTALYDQWYAILEAYSASDLTKDMDRLIAFAGVASHFQALGCGAYVAGLWRDNLASELLWQVRTFCRGRRPGAYCAPSWSWASVRGTVTMERHPDAELDAEVLGVRIEFEDPAFPTGVVRAGAVRLRARLVPLWTRTAGQLAYAESLGGMFLDEDCVQLDDEGERLTEQETAFLPILFEAGGVGYDDGVRGLLVCSLGTGEWRRLGLYYEDEPARVAAVKSAETREITIT